MSPRRRGSASTPAWTAAARSLRRRRSVVLCYHGVGASTLRLDPHFLRVPQERFREQVQLLVHAGFEFVTVARLAEQLRDGRSPPGLAALTFDDGMEDNHAVVLPMLVEWGIPASVYVRTDVIGKPNPALAPESGARMLTESQISDLASAGVEIGAHTVHHPDLSQLNLDDCLREMSESKQTLERITGSPVQTLAYPYCRYGRAALAAAPLAGFKAAVTCQGRGGWAPYEIKRALITGKDGMPSFLLKLADAYQPAFESVPVRVLRRATRAPRRWIRLRLQSRA
jgi:peptidoglycan/xylan/chitin deacetylase (PgdA/CDA1 family)